MSTWAPVHEQEQPKLEGLLTKRQLKHRRNKLAKKFVSLNAEISNLKSQNGASLASKSTNAGFKRKKIRSMKRGADKIAEKLRESEKKLKLSRTQSP